MLVVTLLCAQAVLGVKFTSTKSGVQNEWDGELEFNAGRDKVLTGVESVHDNGKEDRKWKFYTTEADRLKCNAGPWTEFQNDWDGPLDFTCPKDQALTAVASSTEGGSHRQDRRWRFRCCDITSSDGIFAASQKFNIQSVHTTQWLNRFDEKLDAKCNPNSVLVGLKSFHANHQEDRRWAIKCGIVQEKAYPILVLPTPKKSGFLNDWDDSFEWTAPADMIIKNRFGICLDLFQGQLRMQSCSATSVSTQRNQHWIYTSSTGQIKNQHWGGCVEAPTTGFEVRVTSCNTENARQQWEYNASTGLIREKNPPSFEQGRCLSPQSSRGGEKVYVFVCNELNKNELWDIGSGGVKAIVGLASIHHNVKEDRRWKAYYSSTPGLRCEPTAWTEFQNDWDKALDFTCPKNQIMVGIGAVHQNRQEDRRYRFRCCNVESSGFHIGNYRTIGEANEFDNEMDFTCAKNEVLVGLESHHSNSKEDRIFTPKCGTLSQSCSESFSGDGADYRGCQRKSRSGKTCQPWTSQSPHAHSRTPVNYPRSGLGNHNYCRNPDGESTIWCYTNDPNSRWEFCDPLESADTPSMAQIEAEALNALNLIGRRLEGDAAAMAPPKATEVSIMLD